MERATRLGRDPLNEASAPVPVAKKHSPVGASTDNEAIRQYGPISSALDARVPGPNVEVALRIVAERVPRSVAAVRRI